MPMTLADWEAALRSAIAQVVPAVTVTRARMPPKPDRAVCVTCYADPVPASPDINIRLIRFQVRSRQDPTAPDPTAHALAETIRQSILGHGKHLTASAPAARIIYQSGGDMGADSAGRHERTDNYLLTTSF